MSAPTAVGRHPTVLVVEDRDELQTGAERLEVLPQRRHAHVVGVLELGTQTGAPLNSIP